jgi:hypothetical protein
MHEQSGGCQETPPIFWHFVSSELKHSGQISYPNPQVLLFLPNGMAKQHIYVFIYNVNQNIVYKPICKMRPFHGNLTRD